MMFSKSLMITGSVFFDSDCDGVRDSADTPVSGWRIEIRSVNDSGHVGFGDAVLSMHA